MKSLIHKAPKVFRPYVFAHRTLVFSVASCAIVCLSLSVCGCSEVIGIGDLRNTHRGGAPDSTDSNGGRVSTGGASTAENYETWGGTAGRDGTTLASTGASSNVDHGNASGGANSGGLPISIGATSAGGTAGQGGAGTAQAVGTGGAASSASTRADGGRTGTASTLLSGGNAGDAMIPDTNAGGHAGAGTVPNTYTGGHAGAAMIPDSSAGGYAGSGNQLLTFDLERDLRSQILEQNTSASWIPSGGMRVPFHYSSPFLGLEDVYTLPWLRRNQEICAECNEVIEWVSSNTGIPHPVVVLNTSPMTNVVDSVPVPGNSVSLSPGSQGEYAAIIWSSPLKGSASIEAKFTGLSLATTDVHVFSPGKWLYSSDIARNGDVSTFVLSVALEENQIVIFAVGFGSNGSYYADTTQLQVLIRVAF